MNPIPANELIEQRIAFTRGWLFTFHFGDIYIIFYRNTNNPIAIYDFKLSRWFAVDNTQISERAGLYYKKVSPCVENPTTLSMKMMRNVIDSGGGYTETIRRRLMG